MVPGLIGAPLDAASLTKASNCSCVVAVRSCDSIGVCMADICAGVIMYLIDPYNQVGLAGHSTDSGKPVCCGMSNRAWR